MAKHDANPERFARNVDRAIANGKAAERAAAAEAARKANPTRVSSTRADR